MPTLAAIIAQHQQRTAELLAPMMIGPRAVDDPITLAPIGHVVVALTRLESYARTLEDADRATVAQWLRQSARDLSKPIVPTPA